MVLFIRAQGACLNHTPTLANLFLSFLKLGLTAFGGPAMVAYIKEMSVSRYKWLDEETFHDGVVLCQAVPGATAMQTAAYVGFRLKGVEGALSSFVGFGMPAFILMLVLSSLYAKYHALPIIISLFSGLQVVVVAIVANATYSFGRTSLRDYTGTIIAITASALFWANISPFVVITGAALAGLVILRTTSTASAHVQSPKGQSQGLKKTMIFLLVPLSGILVLLLTDVKLFNLAALMIRIDLFAFGGAFASLPLMLHEVVNVRGWMDSKTFMDGIALGQVTPGPIVITSTFVGYMTYGIAGALVATLSIFTPSFLMVIGLTPVMDRLKTSANFLSATKGILASFVGLLFFITIKFALAVPWDLMKVLVGIAAFGALFGKVDILYVILTTAGISLLIF